MPLDTPTLLAADVVITVTVAAALQVYRSVQRTYPGFASWVAGTWLVAAGYLSLASRGLVPALLGIALTNLAFSLGAFARLDGTMQFTGNGRASRWYLLIPAAVTLLCVWPSPIASSLISRTLVGAVGIATFSTLIGIHFIRHAPRSRRHPYRIVGLLHLVFALALAVRGGAWLMRPTVTIFESHPFHTTFFLGALAFEVVWGLAFAMMNGDRLESDLVESRAEVARTLAELQQTLSEVKTLSGLLPLCCSCKRVRDDEGYWNQLEEYLARHTGTQVSHGLCPECARRLYPDVFGPEGDDPAAG